MLLSVRTIALSPPMGTHEMAFIVYLPLGDEKIHT